MGVLLDRAQNGKVIGRWAPLGKNFAMWELTIASGTGAGGPPDKNRNAVMVHLSHGLAITGLII